MLKDKDSHHLQENTKKQLLVTRLSSSKSTSKKIVHKAGEFLGNKIADAVTKLNDGKIVTTDQNQ